MFFINHKPKNTINTSRLVALFLLGLPVGVDCCSDGDAVGGKTRKSSPPSAACIKMSRGYLFSNIYFTFMLLHQVSKNQLKKQEFSMST